MRLRDRFRLITEWKTVLFDATSNWTVLVTSFIVGAVAQWNMAMFAFLAFLPWLWMQILGGGLVLVLLIAGPTITSRLIRQPKMEQKIAVKTEEKAEAKEVEAYRAANP